MDINIGWPQRRLAVLAVITALGLLTFAPPQHLAAKEKAATIYVPLVLTAPPPLTSLLLAFLSDRDSNTQIYTMQADGSGVNRLTDTAWYKGPPVWAPDGTQIAFAANPNTPTTNWDVYAMQSDGSNVMNLTDSPSYDGNLAWSPDGRQIAFESDRDGNNEIYVMDSNGANQVNLTANPARDTGAAWSPDGTQIAFISDRSGTPGLYVMAASGANPTRLADATPSRVPAWSPDGQRIAYAFDSNIWMLALPAAPVQLTDFLSQWASVIGHPVWSPDGAQLVFEHAFNYTPSSRASLYAIMADGSEPTPRNLGQGGYPAWSRDGGYLAYNTSSYAIVGVTAQIHVRTMRNGDDLQLTTGANNYGAVWQP